MAKDTFTLGGLSRTPAAAYRTMKDLISQPTSGETLTGGLVDATNDIPQNTFAGGLLRGMAQGANIAEKGKGATKRERMNEYLMAQQAYAMEVDRHAQDLAQKMERMKLADMEAMQNGTVLANSLQSLELGDETQIRGFLAANQNVAALLGDDGPGGIGIDGVRLVSRDGAKFVQAYGKGPNGEPWAGQEISYDGILKRYARPVLEARSAAELERMKAQAGVDLVQAKIGTENAQQDSFKALAEQRRREPVAASAPSSAPGQDLLPPPDMGGQKPAGNVSTITMDNIPDSMTADQKRAFDARLKMQERQSKEAVTANAKTGVDTVLDDIEAKYKQLDSSGAIVNPEKGLFDNLVAKAASSETGQKVSGAIGADEQSIRQSIKNSLPLLMANIKNSTGMSAQQMNSNAELKFYMQAATDPSSDIQSNLNAIKVLRSMFGAGGQETPVDKPAGQRIRYDAQGNRIQ